MSYDPRSCGAMCDVCPLKGGTVVPPESNQGARIAIVGEAPGEQEEKQGVPLVGPSGDEVMRALGSAKLRRRDLHITNVLLCRPPKNELENLLAKISSENRERQKRNKAVKEKWELGRRGNPWLPEPDYEPMTLSPISACRPRLEAELAEFTDIIALGGTAAKAVMNTQQNIMSIRGGFVELDAGGGLPARRVMPTVHPSFVLRSPRFAHVFRNDIFKAAQRFRGVSSWQPPRVIYHPSPEVLQEFLDRSVPYWTYDLETDGIEPLTAKIRCVGIGTATDVVIVGLLGRDGHTRFYSHKDEFRVIEILKAFFLDEGKIKVGHNSGSYDTNCLNAQWGVWPKPGLDTILMHRLVESELPHGLGFVGSMYTDAPSWKTDREGRKLAFDAETDEQLHTYCAYDVSITAAILPPLFESVRLRQQTPLIELDHKVQRICAEMHMVGMYVDQKKRLAFEQKYIREIGKRLVDLREAAPLPDFNPGSSHQVRKILFTDWKLVAPVDERDRYTASGDPATSDDILRSLLTLKDLEPYQKEFVLKLRRYRKAQKLLGTYIVKLRPWSEQAELGWDEEEDFEDSEMRKKYGIDRVGIVNPVTGRMYPGYNAHVAVTGRLSSSKPINAQNFPKGLRAMVVPQPGHVFIGADADQLELRIAAARWGAARYLRAFDAGADPHSSTAFAVFEDRFQKAEGFPGGRWDGDLFIPDGTGKWGGEAKSLRDLAKRVQYASQYMATVETVHRVIAQTETDNGDGTTSLPYLNLSLREVRRMHEAWLDGCPEFPKGWDMEIEMYRRQGYLAEPITGRRRDFLDGENPNELVNFNIQGSAAGLMNLGMIRLAEEIPVFKYGPGTGLINQCHDAMVLEVPADGATYDAENKKWLVPPGSIPDKTMKLLEECMNSTHLSLPGVRITATADIGGSWKDVG
jgi:DNA polymerase I-like protein with 3'-5' exonuclease and polymerase domains/uracil-DNA glycosylase